jgi:hypothetical protein
MLVEQTSRKRSNHNRREKSKVFDALGPAGLRCAFFVDGVARAGGASTGFGL